MSTPRKIISPGGSEEGGHGDAASLRTASPTNYQLSYSDSSPLLLLRPHLHYNNDNNRIQRRSSRFFLQSPRCAANCLHHVHSSGPGTIVCKSRATHRALITCNLSCYVPHDTKGQLMTTTITPTTTPAIITVPSQFDRS